MLLFCIPGLRPVRVFSIPAHAVEDSTAVHTVPLLLVRTARVYECFLAVQYMADTAAVYTTVRVQQCDPISTSVAHTVRGKLV